MKDLRVTGRILGTSESFRRINPHLYGPASEASTAPAASEGKRVRQDTKPVLNKLESEALRYLQALNPGVNIRGQAKTYKIANGCRLTPDLTAMVNGREVCWEVKGPKAWEDSLIKLKNAPREWPEVQWWLMWKEDGKWLMQEILP